MVTTHKWWELHSVYSDLWRSESVFVFFLFVSFERVVTDGQPKVVLLHEVCVLHNHVEDATALIVSL